jgi:rhamnogalacturonan acetylesterase
MIKDVQEKKAIPILSGMVPTMTWNGDEVQKDFPFSDWARYTAENTAESEGVVWVDHTKYSVERFQALGKVEFLKMFPKDFTHTNSKGAVSEFLES